MWFRFYTLYIIDKIFKEILQKVFTIHKLYAIMIVQEGEYPDISKTTIDIFGAVEFLVLYSTRKEALV